MISKLRFSLIAVILLVLLGFGLQNQAKGEVGGDDQFCPFVENTIGWLQTDLTPLRPAPNVSVALIGTLEGVNGSTLAGMDWQHVDFTNIIQPTPTNETGAQIVTWWTQKGSRDTFLQVTNSLPGFVTVHVRLLDESCIEIRDFCDFYTPGDTHVYDFGDLVTNDGETPDEGVLQGHEGLLTVTAVDDCPSPDQAFEYNGLVGTVQISDTGVDNYGYNAYHRWAVCFDFDSFVDVNLIGNGSFQFGDLTDWTQQQGGASGVIGETGISPNVVVPPCQGPDCDDPDADLFMSYIVSDVTVASLGYGASSSGGSIPALIRANITPAVADNLIGGAVETNVTIVQSDAFTPGVDPDFIANTHTVQYDLAFLAPDDVTDSGCDNYAAVCVVDITPTLQLVPGPPVFLDCDCYNQTGAGNFQGFGACHLLGNDNRDYAIGPFEFQGGTGPFVSGTLTGLVDGNTYVVQYITAQKTNATCATNPTALTRATTGALVDNFRNVETIEVIDFCDGIIDGSFNAFLTDFTPNQFSGQFNLLGASGGGDAVLLNFADQYQPSYDTLPAFVNAQVGVWDQFEDFQSCGDVDVCFLRLGIDTNIVISDDFTPTTTAPPTTAPPSVTIGPSTPPPTNTHKGGGGGGCAIAGNPVQLGTAFANVLIPLVPVAFAFGVRAARRRNK